MPGTLLQEVLFSNSEVKKFIFKKIFLEESNGPLNLKPMIEICIK